MLEEGPEDDDLAGISHTELHLNMIVPKNPVSPAVANTTARSASALFAGACCGCALAGAVTAEVRNTDLSFGA